MLSDIIGPILRGRTDWPEGGCIETAGTPRTMRTAAMTAFAFPRLTAAVIAVALALSALTATPASAMNDGERAALGLIVGLGVLAAIADANGNDHRRPPPPRPQPYDFHRYDRYDRHDRRADACTVQVHRDRHGRRVEVMSAACFDHRGNYRGPDDWRRHH